MGLMKWLSKQEGLDKLWFLAGFLDGEGAQE